jgi:hypothetical protein
MNKLYEIHIRYCGSVGYIGILIVDDKEVYRTGKHYKTAQETFDKIQIEKFKYIN